MKKLFIILAVMAVVLGCTEWQKPQIRQAWGLIEENPESAKVVLAKVRMNSLTEGEKAEYGLLRTIAAYKTSEKIEDDSLITASIAYYNQHGDDWHRGRAYYYRGTVRMSKFGDNPDAIKDFKVAEFISEKADDEDLKNKVYNMLHYVNEIINNHPQTLKYAHKWLDSSIELKDSLKILRNLLMCATAHAEMGQKDSAYTYILKGLELERHADESVLAELYSMTSLMYEERGDTAKAEEYLKKWDEINSYHRLGLLTLARLRKSQGQYERALELVKGDVRVIDSDHHTRIKYLELLMELYELTGDQEQALKTKEQIRAFNDSMKYINQAIQMVEWQQRFDEVQQTKDFYRRTSWMQVLIIAMIVIVSLAIGIGLLLHRRKVHRLSSRLDEDARRISDHRTKIDELESRMERISGTLLVGTQMFSQLQQRQCIADATAKEQQCLVDYFAQLRPKRWQEWERKYSGLSTAQYIFLIMQDDLHYDDESIAAALNVKRTSVRSMRSRIKGRER
jgi:tetratricopeptide (TPR) repeat protein/preprotein translocase subunit SecG